MRPPVLHAAKALSICLAALVMATAARADALQDQFNTVWESLWYQGGVPTVVVRWQGDIHVRIQGKNVAMHHERVLNALQAVSREAGLRVIDVSGGASHMPAPQLEVEIVDNLELQDNLACFVRFVKVGEDRIEKAELKMRQGAVYRCVLHEAMHAMGISGHPTGDTVLSYFYQRVDKITDLDRLMLRTWYSPVMKHGMTPLEAIVVLTDAVVLAGSSAPEPARAAQQEFLARILRQMEAFASEKGEVPVVLMRSGTASPEMIGRGRTLMRFFLGLSHRRGTIGWADPRKAALWIERAARDGLSGAQWMLGDLYERGDGVDASAVESYFWYALASAQKSARAAQALKRVASLMTPDEVDAVKARVAAFK